jgi:hypothetical protein
MSVLMVHDSLSGETMQRTCSGDDCGAMFEAALQLPAPAAHEASGLRRRGNAPQSGSEGYLVVERGLGVALCIAVVLALRWFLASDLRQAGMPAQA